jgi:NADPH-dependent glutamate synthase beta subunit-like oxidoreductase
LALARLAQLGMSVDKFRADVRRTLTTEELTKTMQLGEFSTPAEVARRFALEDEQREVRIANLPLARYTAAVALEPAALRSGTPSTRPSS